MRWAKLKQRLEASFADSMRGRVELHQTRYHNAHDQAGELWITVDGNQIYTAAAFTTEKAAVDLGSEYRKQGMPIMDASLRAYRELEQSGVVWPQRLVGRLEDCLNQSIEQVMASPSPIIRGLGLIDRRFGVRSLERFDASREHAFVAKMFDIRREAEGIPHKKVVGTQGIAVSL